MPYCTPSIWAFSAKLGMMSASVSGESTSSAGRSRPSAANPENASMFNTSGRSSFWTRVVMTSLMCSHETTSRLTVIPSFSASNAVISSSQYGWVLSEYCATIRSSSYSPDADAPGAPSTEVARAAPAITAPALFQRFTMPPNVDHSLQLFARFGSSLRTFLRRVKTSLLPEPRSYAVPEPP